MVKRIKIPLVGGNYKHDSLPFDRQETINMFPERGGKQSKSGGILRRIPGLKPWIGISASSGLIRGMYVNSSEKFFVARGTALVNATNGGETILGTINAGNGKVPMVDNGNQLCVADGTGLWNYESGVLTAITSNAPVSTPSLAFIDGYIFGFDPNSTTLGSFQHSNLNDCTTWNAIDSYTAEGSPDKIITLTALNRQLWVMGSISFEVFYNRGGNNTSTGATWVRIDGTFTDIGCSARDSVVTLSGNIIWLGSSKNGNNVIWISGEGYQPVKISNKPLESTIASMETISDAWGFPLQYEGHEFYGISFPSENKSYLYDLTEGEWITWASRNTTTGAQERIKILTSAYYLGKNLVGDYQNGAIYELDKDTFKDNNGFIVWERYFPYFHNLNSRISWYALFIDIETGIGTLADQGSDPKIQIRWSDDGGRLFGNWHEMGIGVRGAYVTQAIIRMMGQSRTRVFHIRSSEPIPVSIQDNAVAEIEVSDS